MFKGPNRNVLFQTYLFCVTIYGPYVDLLSEALMSDDAPTPLTEIENNFFPIDFNKVLPPSPHSCNSDSNCFKMVRKSVSDYENLPAFTSHMTK